MAKWLPSLRLGIVPPAGHPRCEIHARDLLGNDLSGDDNFKSSWAGVREASPSRLGCSHLQLLAVVLANPDGFIVRNLELHTDERPDTSPLQLSGPLMGDCEIRNYRDRVYATNSRPAFCSADSIFHDRRFEVLVGDVNE